MEQPSRKINQLARAATSLAASLDSRFGSQGSAPSGSEPYHRPESGDSSLAAKLNRLWPQSGHWQGPGLSLYLLDAVVTRRRGELSRLEAHRDSLEHRLRRFQQKLTTQKRDQAQKVEEARDALAGAKRRAAAQQAQQAQQDIAIRMAQNQAQSLQRILQGIQPHGLSGFKDQHGRAVDRQKLLRANQRLEALLERLRREQEQGEILGQRLQNARLNEERAALALEAARTESESLALYWSALARRQRRLEGLAAQSRQEVDRGHSLLRQAMAQRLLFSRVLDWSQELLSPYLEEASQPIRRESQQAVDSSLDQAGRQTRKVKRLSGLLQDQGKRLERDKERIGGLIKEKRALNRQINQLRTQLPGVLEPLMEGGGIDSARRSRAAAGLFSLLEMSGELLPRAQALQNRMDRLRERMSLGIERCRSWQEEWRQAGKQERATLAQAEAQVEEIRLQGSRLLGRSRRLQEELAPLVKALGPMCCEELAPALLASAGLVESLDREGRDLSHAARESAGSLPPAAAGRLTQPPLALKPFTSALRRLGGKQVELDALKALNQSAARWHAMLEGEVAQELRRPAQQVALNLAQSLTRLTAEKVKIASQSQAQAKDISLLQGRLSREESHNQVLQGDLEQSRSQGRQQAEEISRYQSDLQQVSRKAALADELKNSLDMTTRASEDLAQRLEHSQKLAGALKSKALERHRLYRQSQYAVDWLDYWRDRALEQEKHLKRAKAELDAARREHQEASRGLASAVAQRDEAQRLLAEERAARSRQALDLLGGKALSVELAASQSEAGRWAKLAQNMALALAASGASHEKETSRLLAQVDDLSSQAASLKLQLQRIASMVGAETPELEEMAGLPEPPQPASPKTRPFSIRLTPLSPGQVDMALERLARARSRLQNLGKTTLGHWALIAALASGLVLVPPGTPSKATRTEAPLTIAQRPVRHLARAYLSSPVFTMPAQAGSPAGEIMQGGLELNLLPLRGKKSALPGEVKRRLVKQAQKSGLSPSVLLTSVRAHYQRQKVIEAGAIEELAGIARALAKRHPIIFRELSKSGLPAGAKDLAALTPASEKAQHLFLDRIYQEYRSLGFSAEEALGALAANERAFKSLTASWSPPARYRGQVRPVPAIEAMSLTSFLERMTPYIRSKLKVFLRQRGMTYAGDLERYAKNLAFDMYCAAKKFQVPVTFLMAIAHQETWYANVLGDAKRSASPFQIYEPTRELIRAAMKQAGFVEPPQGVKLERHLTMATFMAAFHLRELMQLAYTPAGSRGPASVNMDRVMLRYNGSSRYAHQVGLRKRQLASFLKKKGS